MLDSLRKHALVILVAILFATYRLSRLEGERGRYGANIEQDFENVVGFLHRHLDTKYRVLRIAPPPYSATKLHAMIVNAGFAIPHVEAEVFVDQQFALDQRKQKRRDRSPLPPVRFRVYDADAMIPIAETLQQRNLIASYEQGYQPI
ncbi:hypothetical protein JG687_00002095 [Phytophthora cactorum]|uniref:Uncharacterized protein n=1 Tax=Phytophthora cactorum TaxID=29920 RepID=A0A329SGW1_9STRA|nr:hypothetical protein GQ600_6632 [Phytophthora cactorum]KAG2766029.1 hypothetical protein Pcac1_g22626 [Phytophthora cactorum]KAG2835007.1 hypothetical protein PC112_g5854 [Phytophthora cactorum]KAG2846268.1 hypothetical protein PC111_g1271 [Phytophthora cactorum]KAG2864525.1 hypothetical protein PC113_g4500 [Phytophthora cactorum]